MSTWWDDGEVGLRHCFSILVVYFILGVTGLLACYSKRERAKLKADCSVLISSPQDKSVQLFLPRPALQSHIFAVLPCKLKAYTFLMAMVQWVHSKQESAVCTCAFFAFVNLQHKKQVLLFGLKLELKTVCFFFCDKISVHLVVPVWYFPELTFINRLMSNQDFLSQTGKVSICWRKIQSS